MTWARTGRSTGVTRRRRTGVRRGARPTVTWEASIFPTVEVPTGTLLEFNLSTEAELLARSLGRGTVLAFYGRIMIFFPEGETQGDTGSGAWGIRLKEADAPAGVGAAFSPTTDAESTEWMHWRGFSIFKSSGAGTGSGGAPEAWSDESFVVRNPRKIDSEEELVMLFENAVGSTATVNVAFWCRVLLKLP